MAISKHNQMQNSDLTHKSAVPLRFITCGNVDDGKSTLIGRLLWDTKSVMQDHAADVEAKPVTLANGETHPDFANLLDGLQAEREQGITIDVAYRYFSSERRSFIVADTPGHEQYTRNMATGASNAEVAVILIDAQSGVTEQTRRHSVIVSRLGVREVILAVNKMDLVDFSQQRFEDITRDFAEIQTWLGFETVTAIPIAAIHGYNIVHRSKGELDWYQGTTLLEHLEQAGNAQGTEAPFRLNVQRVARPNESFRGYQGTVTGGNVTKGMEIEHHPSGLSASVESIHTFDGEVEIARPGDAITLCIDRKLDISKGDSLAEKAAPMTSADSVSAVLLVLNDRGLDPQREYLLKSQSHSQTVRVRPAERINLADGQWSDHDELNVNEILKTELLFATPFFFDPYTTNRQTGSFILIDPRDNSTVAGGMIEESIVAREESAFSGEEWTQIALPNHLAEELLASPLFIQHQSQIRVRPAARPEITPLRESA